MQLSRLIFARWTSIPFILISEFIGRLCGLHIPTSLGKCKKQEKKETLVNLIGLWSRVRSTSAMSVIMAYAGLSSVERVLSGLLNSFSFIKD